MTRLSFRPAARAWLGSMALLSAALAPGLALADTTDCTTIVSLPYSITAPGRYCLAGSLATASTAAAKIDIRTSNVLLDCNDNQISYVGPAGSNGIGVRAAGRSDVTVRNCHLLGMNSGIDVTNGHRVRLIGNHVDGALSTGIRITGTQNEASGNNVTNTMGAYGIRVDASADSTIQIRGNVVNTVSPASGAAYGIYTAGSGRVVLRDNVLRDVGNASSSVSTAIMVSRSSTPVPSPVVVMNGGLFKGASANTSYAVQSAAAKVVCEGTSYFFYTPPYNPGCL